MSKKGHAAAWCKTNVDTHRGIPVLPAPGMRTNSQAGLAHFSSFFLCPLPNRFTNKTCQHVHQLCDDRQMFQQNTCQISIGIGWNSIWWNELMLGSHLVQCNIWSIASNWTSFCIGQKAGAVTSLWVMDHINHCLTVSSMWFLFFNALWHLEHST